MVPIPCFIWWFCRGTVKTKVIDMAAGFCYYVLGYGDTGDLCTRFCASVLKVPLHKITHETNQPIGQFVLIYNMSFGKSGRTIVCPAN